MLRCKSLRAAHRTLLGIDDVLVIKRGADAQGGGRKVSLPPNGSPLWLPNTTPRGITTTPKLKICDSALGGLNETSSIST
jgi:hypothetical protein